MAGSAQLQDELARCRARLAERDDENRALRRAEPHGEQHDRAGGTLHTFEEKGRAAIFR